jgi:hypothetical protein
VKSGCDWRSKVVHGARLPNLDAAMAAQPLGAAEDLVRRGLSEALLDRGMLDTFNSKGRDEH